LGFSGSALKQALEAAGLCGRVGVLEEKPSCVLLYCEKVEDGAGFLVAFSSTDGYVYAKIAPEQAVPAHMWHCSDVYYTPYGLYAFANSVEEVVSKLKSKLGLLRAQARLAYERLAATGEGGF
jgi:hypothetical protein